MASVTYNQSMHNTAAVQRNPKNKTNNKQLSNTRFTIAAKNYIYLCVCVQECVHAYDARGHTVELILPFTVVFELRTPGLVASTLICYPADLLPFLS